MNNISDIDYIQDIAENYENRILLDNFILESSNKKFNDPIILFIENMKAIVKLFFSKIKNIYLKFKRKIMLILANRYKNFLNELDKDGKTVVVFLKGTKTLKISDIIDIAEKNNIDTGFPNYQELKRKSPLIGNTMFSVDNFKSFMNTYKDLSEYSIEDILEKIFSHKFNSIKTFPKEFHSLCYEDPIHAQLNESMISPLFMKTPNMIDEIQNKLDDIQEYYDNIMNYLNNMRKLDGNNKPLFDDLKKINSNISTINNAYFIITKYLFKEAWFGILQCISAYNKIKNILEKIKKK